MRSRLTCVISAAMAVLLIVCTVNYAFNTGKEKKKNGRIIAFIRLIIRKPKAVHLVKILVHSQQYWLT